MFLEKYVSGFYLDLIYSNYNEDYLNCLDEEKFKEIYLLFKKYDFNFIEDIILNYLEIFEMDFDDVYLGIEKLKNKLGDNFVYQISNNMEYLSEIIKEIDFC